MYRVLYMEIYQALHCLRGERSAGYAGICHAGVTPLHYLCGMTNKRMCMKTPKEQQVENKIVRAVEVLAALTTDDFTLPRQLIRALLENEELKALQHYANHVSITRLGLNDHGPVHMKKVCYNALKMLRLLHEAAECLPTAPPALLYDMCVDVCHAIYYTTERGKGKIPCPTFLCHKDTAFSALPLDIYQ